MKVKLKAVLQAQEAAAKREAVTRGKEARTMVLDAKEAKRLVDEVQAQARGQSELAKSKTRQEAVRKEAGARQRGRAPW